MKGKLYKIWYLIAGIFFVLAILSYSYSLYKDISAGNRSDAIIAEFDKMLEQNMKQKNKQNSEDADINDKDETQDIQEELSDDLADVQKVPDENTPQEEKKNTDAEKNYDVLGKISVPTLGINLPILTDYSDDLLNVAPCRYFGPGIGEDGHLTILGHNYKRHFGKLTIIKIGTEVILTDIEGNQYTYEVYETEIVKPDQKEALKKYEGKKGLTLITCTDFEGKERTLVRCREIEDSGI